MQLHTQYQGASAIVNQPDSAQVAFATNTLRDPSFFRGVLGRPLAFREGLAALYDVVVSDYRYRPKDRLAFQAWLEDQDRKFLANLGVHDAQVREQIRHNEARLAELDALRMDRLKPFHQSRRQYFEYVYHNQYELNYILDPVITVHPDELSFEAFSQDESSYARLAAKYDLFSKVDEFACGTTNIDFSLALHGQLERMRSYRNTTFAIDPGGFQVSVSGPAGTETHKEKKIDLPDSWVMGFLQVHAVMSMGLTHFQIAPVDLFNICRALRRRKAKSSPRALRWELIPGQRIRVVLEPWEHVIELTDTARWDGNDATVRTWGRDRLQVLARLLPVANSFDVYLAGQGMPSFFVADLGDLVFTLGLSGWTDNDWTSEGGKFDLLTTKLTISDAEVTTTYKALESKRLATTAELVAATSLSQARVESALSMLCRTGRAMFDLAGGVHRQRELFTEPFTIAGVQEAQQAAEKGNPQAIAARRIFERGDVKVIARRPLKDGGHKLSASAKGEQGGRVRPLIQTDPEGQIVTATCTCPFFKSNQLAKGPCEHMLALRLVHMERLRQESP